jgi:folylpolyglutamate synthase/dihydropteroate synthase
MTDPVVTSEHVEFAARWLGKSMLSMNPTQVLLESDDSYIDKFAIHELNRNVDMAWVSQMKIEMLKTIMVQECMTLTLAIDVRLIATAMEQGEGDGESEGVMEEGKEEGGFKGIILDGQHRWEAMKQLKQELPNAKFKIWLIVYIVNNDQEILQRLDTLNKRRHFSQADNDKVAVTKRFLEAFSRKHTCTYQSKRCIVNVRRSSILKSLEFIKKHKQTSVVEFEDKLNAVAEKYKDAWLEARRTSKKCTMNTVIYRTHMYQLIDITCQWLHEL